MPNCGSQIFLCDIPIRFDTYKGCSHGCKYCFVQKKYDINQVTSFESSKALLRFINGKRNQETNWCDWNIPLHWGGVSDPFQPAELKYKRSLDCLKVFSDSGYPFVVSTKSILPANQEYYQLLKNCNFVFQMSMACSSYDNIEPVAPCFTERFKILEKLSKIALRIIIRIQPYIIEKHKDIIANIPKYSEAGVYGVIVEAIKFPHRKQGLVKLAGDYVYPYRYLESYFKEIKHICHENNLKFYSGENRLRNLGDSLTCCGCDDLDGFKVNKANLNHYLFDSDNFNFTEKMNEPSTSYCFQAGSQNQISSKVFGISSYREIMELCTKDKNRMGVFLNRN